MIDREPGLSSTEIPQELKAQCEQEISEIAELLPLPPSLIKALEPDRFLLHLTGYEPYDKAYIDGLPQDLSKFVQHFLERYQKMEKYTNVSDQITTVLRHMRRTGKSVNEELTDEWVASTRHFARDGLTSSLLFIAFVCDSLNYHLEGQPFWDYDCTSFIKTSDPELADEDGKIHESRVAAYLAEQGKRNLSAEKLNARFEHTMALYQLTITDSILWQTVSLVGLGKNKQQKSLSLFEKCKQLLPEDDIYSKLDLITDLAATTQRFAQSEPDRGRKQVYSNLFEGNSVTLATFEARLDFYMNVYKTLGYELPPLLAYREQNKGTRVAEAAGSAETDAVLIAANQAEVTQPPLEELEELMHQLGLNVDTFNREWTLTGQKKKELKNLRGAFVMGSGEALPGVPKERAAELADVLARLHIFGTQEAGMNSLAEQLQYQTDLQAEIKDFLELLDEITPRQLTVQGLALRDIKGDIAHIKKIGKCLKV